MISRWEEVGRPLVLGHRGAPNAAEENTLESFSIARDVGADGIEFDVHSTSDDVLVIHHDDKIRGFGQLRTRRFSDLRASYPSIPTIDEVVEVSGDMILNIEIKNHPQQESYDPHQKVTRLLADWAASAGLAPRMLVTSFNGETVDQMRFVDRSIATGRLFDPRDDPNEYLGYLAGRGHGWILPYKRHLRRNGAQFVAAAHRHGMAVGVWTVNRRSAFRAARDMGVAAVITDEPAKGIAVYS
jgi:glycerophosphoryl diester phosphodiesterase